MARLGRYIERNPVVGGIEEVEKPWDYGWSSAKAYVEGVNDPHPIKGNAR